MTTLFRNISIKLNIIFNYSTIWESQFIEIIGKFVPNILYLETFTDRQETISEVSSVPHCAGQSRFLLNCPASRETATMSRVFAKSGKNIFILRIV